MFGRDFNNAAPILAATFFSPRLIAARVKMLNPATYILEKDPILRQEKWKSLLSFGAISLSVLGLAKYGLGLDVEDNPLSADFAKIKSGNTRADTLGGFQQYIHFAAQMLTNKKINGKGEEIDMSKPKFGQDTRADVAIKFLRSKTSPVASLVWDMLDGKDYAGVPFSAKKEIASRMIPLAAQDVANVLFDQHNISNPLTDPGQALQDVGGAVKDNGAKAAALSVPTVFGVGMQTYTPRQSKPKSGSQWWEDSAFGGTSNSDMISKPASKDWWKDPAFGGKE